MKHLFLLFLTLSLSNLYAQQSNDSTAIVKLLKADYSTLQTWDMRSHVANCTKDYLLIENGEIWNVKKEMAFYKENAKKVTIRKDDFTIKTIKIYGNMGYAVYDLKSEIKENNISTLKHWNGSAIFRKINGQWKIALVHSTPFPVVKPYASFDHVALLVRNVDKSAAFYSQLFEVDTIPVPGHPNKVIWFKINDGFQLHLVEGAKDMMNIPFNHVAFSVRSINGFIAKLNQAHIPYYGEQGKNSTVVLRADDVHQIYFKDPDGYTMEVNDRSF
jgi:lactoylglutathione lyase